MKKSIAFIGTRDLDKVEGYNKYVYLRAVEVSVALGLTITTGAAVGADQLAAETALKLGGCVNLKLPWENYEANWYNNMAAQYPEQGTVEVYNPSLPLHQDWTNSVSKYHPNFSKLTRGDFALQARNYGIVCNAKAVIAISNPTKVGGGGTGQGIRIARALNIPCYDVTVEKEAIALERYIDKAYERLGR